MTAEDFHAALLEQAVAAGQTLVTRYADGTTTWAFRPARERPDGTYGSWAADGALVSITIAERQVDGAVSWYTPDATVVETLLDGVYDDDA